MTVKELMDNLSAFPSDTEVVLKDITIEDEERVFAYRALDLVEKGFYDDTVGYFIAESEVEPGDENAWGIEAIAINFEGED